jgi:hypothetical protein
MLLYNSNAYSLALLLSWLSCWNACALMPVTTSKSPLSRARTRTSCYMEIRGVAASGIHKEERRLLFQKIESKCNDLFLGNFQWEDTTFLPALQEVAIGVTGRVLVLSTNEQENSDYVKSFISQAIDELLYDESNPVNQPIMLCLQPPITQQNPDGNNKAFATLMQSAIEQDIEQFDLAKPIQSSANRQHASMDFTPTEIIEVDGAMVIDPSTSQEFWDTSSLLVFDHLVSDSLRRRMLDVVLGEENDCDDTNGPNPERWERGGLMDINSDDEDREAGGFGLSDEAIDEINFQDHAAFQEFESVLAELLSDFVVSRMPEAVLGDSVTPLNANAPIHGHDFEYHIDACPMLAPPSPWTDVYGRYPNRCPGKPRFMSCIVYLNDEWKSEEWGAPTRSLDVATDTPYDTTVKPGRFLLMDQDITHTVVAPEAAAGKRPRYSLVWKLVLHPTTQNQDMCKLSGTNTGWPKPILVGSANRGVKATVW